MSRITADARPNPKRKRVRFVNRVIGALLIHLAWTRIFVRPKVRGRKHLKNIEGPAIVIFNHLSVFDIPALAGLIVRYRRDALFMAHSGLFKNRLVAAVLKWFGTIPVHRDTDRAAEASDRAIQALNAGCLVIMSIEGGISKSGELLPPKGGAAYMALVTGAPVIMVGLWGTQNVKRPGSKWWQWGWSARYGVAVERALLVSRKPNATSEDRAQLTRILMDRLARVREQAIALAAK